MNDLGDPKWMRCAQMFDRSRDAGECVIASWRRKGALRWLLNVCRKEIRNARSGNFIASGTGVGLCEMALRFF